VIDIINGSFFIHLPTISPHPSRPPATMLYLGKKKKKTFPRIRLRKDLPQAAAADVGFCREFKLGGKVTGVCDKGEVGSVVEIEQLLVEKGEGEVFARMVGNAVFIGGVPKGPKTEIFPPPAEGRRPDCVEVVTIGEEAVLLYQ
jgi:hypothetical protein